MATRPYKLSSNIPTVRLSNSRPFITQKAVLNSLHAQQIFERGYDMCANGLFSLTVVLRFIGTEDQAQAVEKMVDDLLNSTLTEIRQEIERMHELSEASGCETGIGYTNARTVEIQITSPRSIRCAATRCWHGSKVPVVPSSSGRGFCRRKSNPLRGHGGPVP